jgi:hypothetical protein
MTYPTRPSRGYGVPLNRARNGMLCSALPFREDLTRLIYWTFQQSRPPNEAHLIIAALAHKNIITKAWAVTITLYNW